MKRSIIFIVSFVFILIPLFTSATSINTNCRWIANTLYCDSYESFDPMQQLRDQQRLQEDANRWADNLNQQLLGNVPKYSSSCSSGYVYFNGRCITLDQTCKEKYGRYSYFMTDGNYACNCLSGYEFKDHYCVQKATAFCPQGYLLSNNKCITHTERCKKSYGENVYGVKGDDNSSTCYCLAGYKWNSNKALCIKNEIITYPKIKGIDDILENKEANDIFIPEGALIKTTNNPDIYIVKYVGTKKFKRLILSPSVFNNYGHLKWEDVMDVSQAILDSFTTSELVRVTGDDKIYRLYPQGDKGQKRLIKNNSVLARLGFDPDSIYEINSFDRESYTTGDNLE